MLSQIVDDQLSSTKDKIEYAIEKLEENDPDEVKLVIKEKEVILIVKIENTIDIRVTSEDVVGTRRLFEDYIKS